MANYKACANLGGLGLTALDAFANQEFLKAPFEEARKTAATVNSGAALLSSAVLASTCLPSAANKSFGNPPYYLEAYASEMRVVDCSS